MYTAQPASQGAQLVKNPPAVRETWIRSLSWEWSPGEGKGYPLQYFGLENFMGCMVPGVTKNRTWLSDSRAPKHRLVSSDAGSIHPLTRCGQVPYSFCSSVSLSEKRGRIYRLVHEPNISSQHMSGTQHVLINHYWWSWSQNWGAGYTLQDQPYLYVLLWINQLHDPSVFQVNPDRNGKGGSEALRGPRSKVGCSTHRG